MGGLVAGFLGVTDSRFQYVLDQVSEDDVAAAQAELEHRLMSAVLSFWEKWKVWAWDLCGIVGSRCGAVRCGAVLICALIVPFPFTKKHAAGTSPPCCWRRLGSTPRRRRRRQRERRNQERGGMRRWMTGVSDWRKLD